MMVGEDSVQYRKRKRNKTKTKTKNKTKQNKTKQNKKKKKKHCFLVAAILSFISKIIITFKLNGLPESFGSSFT